MNPLIDPQAITDLMIRCAIALPCTVITYVVVRLYLEESSRVACTVAWSALVPTFAFLYTGTAWFLLGLLPVYTVPALVLEALTGKHHPDGRGVITREETC